MKQVNRFLENVYRLCDTPDEVNWDARRHINTAYYADVILPHMRTFLDQTIKATTFRRTRYMNGLIGLSGGLDSTVAAYVTAQAMQQSVDEGKTTEANLALISFTGLEDNDTRAVTQDLQRKFPSVHIKYHEEDIRPEIRKVTGTVEDLVDKLDGNNFEIPGEVLTRLVCSLLNEVSTRTGYATIDTTNGTEYVLGEFTVGLGYDVSLLTDLYKSSVFVLGELLDVPQAVLDAHPINSAFSFTNKPSLYFGNVPEGITARHVFEVLDPVLYWLYERKKLPKEIAAALGHSEDFVKRTRRRIRYQEHRRETPTFCVESHTLDFPNRTDLSDKEAKKVTEKEMLVEAFT